MATVTIRFAFDEAAHQQIPHLKALSLPIGPGPAPDKGDLLRFDVLRDRWFVVMQRQISYEMNGNITLAVVLALTKERWFPE